MYTDADRERDQYISKQIKATAQLVIDYGLRTDTRIAALEAAVSVLANANGLDPNLVAKLIAEKVAALDIDIVVTAPQESQ